MTTVALIDRSTIATAVDLDALAKALTIQVGHLADAGYNVFANVKAYRREPPADAWQLVILDDTDQADALGYHTTTPEGHPLGRVFVRTVTEMGLNWTVTASHELIEMLVDPWAVLAVDLGDGTWVAWEACDPVEADAYGYLINGVAVSDFITPAWFTPGAAGPYDYRGHLHRPLALLPGGYAAVQRDGEWTNVMAQRPSPDGPSRAQAAQRIDRRRAHRRDGLET